MQIDYLLVQQRCQVIQSPLLFRVVGSQFAQGHQRFAHPRQVRFKRLQQLVLAREQITPFRTLGIAQLDNGVRQFESYFQGMLHRVQSIQHPRGAPEGKRGSNYDQYDQGGGDQPVRRLSLACHLGSTLIHGFPRL
jgi:hypothetical protein